MMPPVQHMPRARLPPRWPSKSCGNRVRILSPFRLVSRCTGAKLEARIRELSQLPATPVSLRDLYKYGSVHTDEQLLKNAQFLHRELPIRLAQRVHDLQDLPLGLPSNMEVQQVVGWFTSYCRLLLESKYPETTADERAFTTLCEHILQDPAAVVTTLSAGIQQLRATRSLRWRRTGGDRELDFVLNRFYMARIGLRFLLEHHVASSIAKYRKDGHAGIIASAMSPMFVAQQAAADAAELCELHLGDAPEITFHGQKDVTMTYVPSHLYYSACRPAQVVPSHFSAEPICARACGMKPPAV